MVIAVRPAAGTPRCSILCPVTPGGPPSLCQCEPCSHAGLVQRVPWAHTVRGAVQTHTTF